MTDITMPRLSDSMEEGTILNWLKADGEDIRRGDDLAEIETDKATMTFEAEADGVLTILAREGETLPVGAPIAHLAAGGSGAATIAPPREPRPAVGEPTSQPADKELRITPVARRMAQAAGVIAEELTGTGPTGRIVKADVQLVLGQPVVARDRTNPQPGSDATAATSTEASPHSVRTESLTASPRVGPPPPVAPPSQEPGPGAKGQATVQKLTRIQQTVARRMAESKATVPDFSVEIDVDMSACVELRAQLKAMDEAATPTYNDMIIKACATALRRHPHVNGAFRDNTWELYSRVNVGMAVAAEEALVVPTVFDADQKALGAVARETRRLAEAVRERTITPRELAGGTFTVSNLGMFGVRRLHAVINPPQSAILGVGAMEPRPVVLDGQVVVRPTLALTLAGDHRILNGADAARLLADLRDGLERPLSALL